MTMIEKVAAILYTKLYIQGERDLKEVAKAAIEAMREPTEEMKSVGASKSIYHCWSTDGEFTDAESAGEIYHRMIDAALKE